MQYFDPYCGSMVVRQFSISRLKNSVSQWERNTCAGNKFPVFYCLVLDGGAKTFCLEAYFYHSEKMTSKASMCSSKEQRRRWHWLEELFIEFSMTNAIEDYHRGDIFSKAQRFEGLGGFGTTAANKYCGRKREVNIARVHPKGENRG